MLAFDALIQNPDRRWNNPKCLVRGEERAIFDHDLAFSFLAGVIGAKHPWQPGGRDFLASRPNRHVFFDGLKGTQLNFDRLVGAFESIDQHGRLGKVFPGMNGEAFKSLMRFIQSRFEEILSAFRRGAPK